MRKAAEPYLWMGPSYRGGGWNAWLEFSVKENTHAALVEIAERLCRDFGAVVTERFPEDGSDEYKEYWWLQAGPAKLMLMRKPPGSVGMSLQSGDVEFLLRIGQAWGVRRFVGWRWVPWRIWRRYLRRQA